MIDRETAAEGVTTRIDPVRDPRRLEALRRSALLDSPPEEPFDRLARLAARILHVPIALVVLVDEDRQFFKSAVGLPEPLASKRETPLSHSFCQHSVRSGQPLIVVDARKDPLVRDNLAVPDLGVVAYAGIPMVTSGGQVIGNFCAIDHEPRVWTDEEIEILKDLTASVMTEFELRDAAREAQREIERRTRIEEERAALSRREQEAQARSEAAERTLSAVLERVPAGIVLVDAEGTVLFLNEFARELSGTLPDGATPLALQTGAYQIRDATTGQALVPEETPIGRALRGETVEKHESVFRQPGELRDRWLRVSAVPLYGNGSTLSGAVAVFTDVTAEREREQQKDDFLSAIAHDLKTPLTTIKGFTQLLQRRLRRGGPPDLEQMTNELRQIEATATRMVALINELQDLARIRLDEPLRLNRQRTNLVTLVRGAVAEQQHVTPEHDITFHSEEESLICMGDTSRLERIIANLLSNAVKYSPDGGRVDVRLEREDENCARLSVKDSGIGIPAADLPRIFDRFYRASNVTEGIPGTGIGLAAVRHIVEQHGGTIEVESREGEGTTFTVRLPLNMEEDEG